MEKIKDVVCKKCGLINSVHIVEKGVHKMAFCDGCGAWVKNIGYDVARFYVGKYKGMKVEDVDDKNYLEWFLRETKPKEKMKEALEAQIKKLLI